MARKKEAEGIPDKRGHSDAGKPLPSPSRAPVILDLKGVVKSRDRGGQRFELLIPEMAVRRGEFVAVVGESGCGKSTTLDMLGLVLRPTSAERFQMSIPDDPEIYNIMSVSDQTLSGLRRCALGYVLQTGGLFPFLTVRENILLSCWINKVKGREEYVKLLSERLKIERQMDKKPQHLSGGQRQRVAIARALAHQPPLVLADEPTGAVDKITAREIRDTFKELTHQLGVTLIMVTHDVELIRGVADRIFTYKITRPSSELTQSTFAETVL